MQRGPFVDAGGSGGSRASGADFAGNALLMGRVSFVPGQATATSRPPLVDKVGDEGRPAGLVARAQAGAGVAVEILEEQ
jgi:hypothetical protein